MKRILQIVLLLCFSSLLLDCSSSNYDQARKKRVFADNDTTPYQKLLIEQRLKLQPIFEDGKSLFYSRAYVSSYRKFQFCDDYGFHDSVKWFYELNLLKILDDEEYDWSEEEQFSSDVDFIHHIYGKYQLNSLAEEIDSLTKVAHFQPQKKPRAEFEETKGRDWKFFDDGYYEMVKDPEFTYAGVEYIYVWFDRNSVLWENDLVYVMIKFSYYLSGSCPTYEFLSFDTFGNRTTIDLYHSCAEVYTGIRNWKIGKVSENLYNLLREVK